MKESLVIIGAGGHGHVVAEMIKEHFSHLNFLGAIDSNPNLWGTEIGNARILGGDELLPHLKKQGARYFVITVGVEKNGSLRTRRELFDRAVSAGLEPYTLIHPRSFISPSAAIGLGSTVLPRAVIHTKARLGKNTIINTGAIVEHNAVVGSHSHLAPGATLCGNVTLGEEVCVGARATILTGLSLASFTVVGAGAVVTKSISRPVTVVGVPARAKSSAKSFPSTAVIMAGGAGSRLQPFTDRLPKALVPLSGRPIIERILSKLASSGILRTVICAHHKASLLRSKLGDGSEHGIKIEYVVEDEPLGTAGGLAQLKHWQESFLLINGDVLCDLDLDAMVRSHQERRAHLTIGTVEYLHAVPYGVVRTSEHEVLNLEEKPLMRLEVNAGVYLIEPEILNLLEPKENCGMTELIQRTLAARKRVNAFPISGYWRDVGSPPEFLAAEEDARLGRLPQ